MTLHRHARPEDEMPPTYRPPWHFGHPSQRVVTKDDVTRILSRVDSDATQPLPKLPPATSWLETPTASYPSVRVPENRSSIPGVGHKRDILAWVVVFAWLTLLTLIELWAWAR